MALQRGAALRLDPAEAAALDDGGVRGFAQLGHLVVGELRHQLDRELGLAEPDVVAPERAHGVHRRKFARMRSPTSALFSTWNWVPATLPRATMATTGPP
jgi:hypothetical protein